MGGCCGKEEAKQTNVETKQVAPKKEENENNNEIENKNDTKIEIEQNNDMEPPKQEESKQQEPKKQEEQKQSQPQPAETPLQVNVANTQVECPRCHVKLESRDELDIHLKETHSCPNCNKTFDNKEAIEQHLPKCGKRMVECPECKQQVMKQDLKGSHLADCNSQECQFCQKQILKSMYDDHIQNKCLKRTVVTPCCSKEMLYSEMVTHVAKCPDVLEDCDYCGEDVKRSELEAHEAECEAKQKDAETESPDIDQMTPEQAKERLSNMKTSVGFVAMDCPERGIRVVRLRPGSGSLYSFVCNGDLIRKIEDKDILSIDDLKEYLLTKMPGDVVETIIKRGVDGRIEKIQLELCAQGNLTGESLGEVRKLRQVAGLPTSMQQIFSSEEALKFVVDTKNRIGFIIQDGPEDGIRISKVTKKGPAWRAGIRPMDVVTKVNNEKVTTKKEFAAIWNTFKCGDPVPFEVERAGYLMQEPCMVEVGAKSNEKDIVERVRAMRIAAGLEIFEPEGLSDSDTDDASSDSSKDSSQSRQNV